MADSSANLKVKATMDNADLKKKCKESKDALRDFSKVSEDAVDALGDALGINLNKFGEISNAIKGLGIKLKDSGDKGVAAFGKLLTNVNSLTVGLAGIGIAGVVAGFKLLNEEAEAFKNTLEGAKIDVMTTAYVETYRQVLHGFNAETGRSVAEASAIWTKQWNKFKSDLFHNLLNIDLETALLGPVLSTAFGLGDTSAFEAAGEAAKMAERLAGQIAEKQELISRKTQEWAQAEAEITRLRTVAAKTTINLEIRQKAINDAITLTNQLYGERAKIQNLIVNYQKQYNDLQPPSKKNLEILNQEADKHSAILEKHQNLLKEINGQQAALTAEAEKEAAARAAALAAAEKMAQRRAEADAFAESMAITSSVNTPNEVVQMKPVGIAVRPELDVQSAIDVSEELQQIMTSSFETIGVAIGGLIGDLATGGDAWANFADTAISAFADLATFVGKTAISTGVATLGIKAALESLNGWVAIAAGVALVALGSAVKSSLSNAASGSYGYTGGGVASASGSYGSSSSGFGTGFEMREMTVNVTGTLRADGNQLLTVIENENKRKNHTT